MKCKYFYRPQRSCEGYVFTGVCLSTWGVSASVHAGMPPPWEQTYPRSRHPPGRPPWEQTPHPPEQTPPWEQTPPEQTPSPPGADTPPSRPPWEQTPPPRDGHCCGRYASYWNAFLLPLVIRLGKSCEKT